MVTFLNQKLLTAVTDPQAVGYIKDCLQRANIQYAIDPVRTGTAWGQRRNAQMAASLNLRYSQFDNTSYLYRVYVRRRDLSKAREALAIQQE